LGRSNFSVMEIFPLVPSNLIWKTTIDITYWKSDYVIPIKSSMSLLKGIFLDCKPSYISLTIVGQLLYRVCYIFDTIIIGDVRISILNSSIILMRSLHSEKKFQDFQMPKPGRYGCSLF